MLQIFFMQEFTGTNRSFEKSRQEFARNAIVAIRYMWSAILSGFFTPCRTHPVRGVAWHKTDYRQP